MTVYDDIQAVLSSATLTPTQKREQVTALRVGAWATAMQAVLPISRVTPRGTLTINTVTVVGDLLRLTGRGVLNDPATSDGSWTWEIVNPPVLVPDPAGTIVRTSTTPTGVTTTSTYRLDPLAALGRLIIEMAR